MQNYLRRIHPDDLPAIESEIARVFADPKASYKLEYRVVSPQGAVRWIDIRGDAERDCTGRPIMFRGVVMDVTDRKAGACSKCRNRSAGESRGSFTTEQASP